MNRTLRGLRARAGALTTLGAMTAVVVAGVVAVDAFAAAAGTSRLLAAPLLLLGLVAVPGTGRELGSVRRNEIALARLRGLRGARLVRTVAAEPLLVMLAGAVVGLPLGAAVAGVAGHRWLGTGAPPTAAGALAALLVVLVGAGAVLTGMARALREPLSEQLGSVERPRASTVAGVFGALLVLAAAAVALYRSGSTAGAGGLPDVVVLLGPAFVGLAAGLGAVWLVRVGAAAAVRRTDRSDLPRFLAVRRLARSADRAAPVRLLVAAAALGAVALTGGVAVTGWASQTARIRIGAPRAIPVDVSPAAALALTRRLDPGGRHLMAALVVPADEDTVDRRAYVDTSRYAAVSGGFLAGTPAAALTAHLADLRDPATAPRVVRGDAVVIGVGGLQGVPGRPVAISVGYVDDQQETRAVTGRLRLGASAASVRVALPHCAGGCVVESVSFTPPVGPESVVRPDDPLQRPPGGPAGTVVLDRLTIGATDLTTQRWSGGTRTADGLTLVLHAYRATDLTLAVTLPVVTTPGVHYITSGSVKSPGGNDWRADVVGASPALPLVGGSGMVADLPRALLGASSTVPTAEVEVLVADGTPAAMLRGLGAGGGGRPVTLASVRGRLTVASGSAQAQLYALVALVCLPLALLVLAAAGTRQRRLVTAEVAALRVVGVPAEEVRRAGRVELVVLVAAALLGGAVGALVGVSVLLPHLPLVRVPAYSTPLHVGFRLLPFAGVLLVAALALWWLGARARQVSERRTRPARLREGGLP